MDEHVWTSPCNAIDIVEHITEELCSLDPEHGQTYKDNAEAYETQLKELDTSFRNVVENAKNYTLCLETVSRFDILRQSMDWIIMRHFRVVHQIQNQVRQRWHF